MNLTFNGQALTLDETSVSLSEFVIKQGAKPPFALTVNGQFIPRSAHETTSIQAGDEIELLSPIQGG